MRLRVAAVVSGKGSNLEALLRSLGPDAPAQVVLVLSNRAQAGGLELARRAGVPTHVFEDIADPAEWLRVLEAANAGLIVLAGFLKRVPAEIVHRWRGRIINIHPALLPRHGGAGMYGAHVHRAVLDSGDSRSGATVHLVTEEYDQGPILGQAEVPVLPGDTAESLASRVLDAEHRLLPAAVIAAAAAGRPVPFVL
jgi:formyltetrahydrofolate-dependent phosphoribosylglycinamide formyltransferase